MRKCIEIYGCREKDRSTRTEINVEKGTEGNVEAIWGQKEEMEGDEAQEWVWKRLK